MIILSVLVPSAGRQTIRRINESGVCAPGLYLIQDLLRKVGSYVHHPSDAMSFFMWNEEPRAKGSIRACTSYDIFDWWLWRWKMYFILQSVST